MFVLSRDVPVMCSWEQESIYEVIALMQLSTGCGQSEGGNSIHMSPLMTDEHSLLLLMKRFRRQ